MKAWGFQYKGNLVWHKIRKDGGSDGRGVGFYFRKVTELILRDRAYPVRRSGQERPYARAWTKPSQFPIEPKAGTFAEAG
jgi:hypothetical protein